MPTGQVAAVSQRRVEPDASARTATYPQKKLNNMFSARADG